MMGAGKMLHEESERSSPQHLEAIMDENNN